MSDYVSRTPYKFTFDLSSLPKAFFQELTKVTVKVGVHRKVGGALRTLVKKFKLQEITGLDIAQIILLLEDFIEIEVLNMKYRDLFRESRGKKALFLPHCARKYMDSRCKAYFDPKVPTYICKSCSPDCLINQATNLAKEKGYDVYVVPGGSCIPKILSSGNYSAVVGVACGEELKLGHEAILKYGIAAQAVPLLRNGCAGTWFDLEHLRKVLSLPEREELGNRQMIKMRERR